MSTRLNRRERKAKRLLEHFDTCERLAACLGVPDPDGKRVSVALFKAQRLSEQLRKQGVVGLLGWLEPTKKISDAIGQLPPGFEVGPDGALRIDPADPQGRALIEAVRLPVDAQGFGLLSPLITGDAP